MPWRDRERQVAAFRRSGARWWMTLCTGLFFVIGFATVFDDHEDSYYGPDSGFALGSRVFYGLIAAVSLFVAIRWFRMGIFVTPTEVVVRNVFSTSRLPWSEIAGFGRPAGYGAWRGAGLPIRLRDGRVVTASLYSAGPFNRGTFADVVLEELRELQARYGSGPPIQAPNPA